MPEPSLVQQILNSLLDRFEQPGRQRVIRVRLNARDHAAYFSATTGTPRLETNAALQELARQNLLQLHWRKWEEGNWLAAIDLIPTQADAIYARLSRTPRGAQEKALRELLATQTACASWHMAFLAWAQSQLELHRSVAPLDLDDPQWNADLLRGLDALAQLQTPTLERAFSVRLFADSKRFEDLRAPVISVLRRFDFEAGMYGDDDRALLRAHRLERVPEYVPLAGALALNVEGQVLALTPFVPSVALSAAMLRVARIHACPVHAVVTVENATSFNELLPHVQPLGILAVYTGGFASPSVIAFLQNLRAARTGILFFHWGDLDAGGLRILAHLRKQLGMVASLAMNAETFNVFRAYAQPLNADDRTILAQLGVLPDLTDCAGLIETLLAAGHKLEQEAVPVETVVQALAPLKGNVL